MKVIILSHIGRWLFPACTFTRPGEGSPCGQRWHIFRFGATEIELNFILPRSVTTTSSVPTSRSPSGKFCFMLLSSVCMCFLLERKTLWRTTRFRTVDLTVGLFYSLSPGRSGSSGCQTIDSQPVAVWAGRVQHLAYIQARKRRTNEPAGANVDRFRPNRRARR